MADHYGGMRSTYVPGMDDYYAPAVSPVLISPEPQRFNPEMSSQIANGIQNMDLNSGARTSTMSTASAVSSRSTPSVRQSGNHYSNLLATTPEVPHLSPFPKLVNPPPNTPPSDDELEATLENARSAVLNSNDPEMQLAWAQDALAYCGVCADEAERLAAADPHRARPSTPRIEHQLKTDAVNVVSFLADQHHPKAEFLRGMWLEWGRFGQREDKKEAFRCYSRAADKGYARAEYRLGMLYESYNDPIKALRHYHRGVEAGDAASCYRLGMMTLRGQHGQPQDFAKGLDLIRRSAETADENAAQGAYVYGMLLARQLPQVEVPERYLALNERLAKENIEKAAYMRFAKAQAKMGSAYELGSLGCEFSPALSIHYNALASKQGESEADMALSKWFLVGCEGLFPKNEELAYTYAQRAAAAGLATAEFGLGYFNEIGMHVPINLDKALEWYQKAAQHGNEDAKGRITALSNKQVLSRKDHENIAVSKIKSQRGSMIAARPERFQSQQSQLARVDERPANGNAFPARGSSTTPYPADDRPPTVAPASRPATTVPYPMGDTPASAYSSPRLNAGPSPNPGFSNQGQFGRPPNGTSPDLRPSSAFQMNPDYRTNPGSPLPPAGNMPPPAGQRPYGGYPGPSGHSGRPQPPPGSQQQGYDPRLRPTSNPAPGNRAGASPGTPQGYRPPNGGPGYGPAVSTRIDVGYSAPYEDRRPQQPQQQPRPNLNQQRPPPAVGAAQQQRPSTASPTTARPSDHRRPVVAPAPPQKDTSGAPKPASKPAAPPSPPKGPKTFDEMGVPKQKRDEECVRRHWAK